MSVEIYWTFQTNHKMKSVKKIFGGAIFANASRGEGNSLTTIPDWILEMDSLELEVLLCIFFS